MDAVYESGIGAVGITPDRTTPLTSSLTREQVANEIPPANAEIAVRQEFFDNFPHLLSTTSDRSPNDYRFLASLITPGLTHGELPNAGKEFSPRYLAETPQLFFQTVDAVMTETGVDGKEVAKKIEDPAKAAELLAYIEPVYIILRIMGYHRAELVA
jgi:hypothetical protein